MPRKDEKRIGPLAVASSFAQSPSQIISLFMIRQHSVMARNYIDGPCFSSWQVDASWYVAAGVSIIYNTIAYHFGA